jgi:hypothetical protein
MHAAKNGAMRLRTHTISSPKCPNYLSVGCLAWQWFAHTSADQTRAVRGRLTRKFRGKGDSQLGLLEGCVSGHHRGSRSGLLRCSTDWRGVSGHHWSRSGITVWLGHLAGSSAWGSWRGHLAACMGPGPARRHGRAASGGIWPPWLDPFRRRCVEGWPAVVSGYPVAPSPAHTRGMASWHGC